MRFENHSGRAGIYKFLNNFLGAQDETALGEIKIDIVNQAVLQYF
jgi:hypothetical protein